MKIAVCDDNPVFCNQMVQLIRQEEQENGQFDIHVFCSGEKLLEAFEQKLQFDLIFLDIEMGEGITGIETAVRIRQQNQDVMLVFVTAHMNFVFEAFDVQAMQYLLKPIDLQQFQRVFHRCRRKYFDEEYRFPFRIRNDRGQEEILLLMVKNILYIESYLRKLHVYTIYGYNFEMAGKISEMEDLLAAHGFIRLHKSYLVNLKYLRVIESDQILIQVASDQEPVMLPLSRRKREQVKKAFLQYKVDDIAK